MSILILLGSFVFLLLLIGLASAIFLRFAPWLGGRWDAEDLERMRLSDQYDSGRFRNDSPLAIAQGIPSSFSPPERPPSSILWEFLRGREDRRPSSPVPNEIPDFDRIISAPSHQLRVTWFGHSTCLIELEGKVFMTDPVFVHQPSPLPGMGPKTFPGSNPFQADDIPHLDAIVLSHDHYDHLDYHTIRKLDGKTDKYFVPLGVAAHLKRWGISGERIVELDWWESRSIEGSDIIFTATPAQHFSGRNPFEQNHTLWAGWAIRGKTQSVYFGGDSGYGDLFGIIGERLGPFDITMLDSAQYSVYWSTIHMHPEETVRAHRDLGGNVLLPIHWGKFNLSIHPWTEPMERIIACSALEGVQVATPIIGESFIPSDSIPQRAWWREL